MPEFRKQCDIFQGFDFKKDKQTVVAHITHLTIAGTVLPPDLTCKDPINPQRALQVVAVCSDVMWELGVTDAVYFSGQVSAANKQNILSLVYNTLANTAVVVQFTVYAYDQLSKAYFKTFDCSGTDLAGLLEKRGGDLNLTVSDDASTEVPSPENYSMNIGIKPQQLAQSLTVAMSSDRQVIKSWGLQVA